MICETGGACVTQLSACVGGAVSLAGPFPTVDVYSWLAGLYALLQRLTKGLLAGMQVGSLFSLWTATLTQTKRAAFQVLNFAGLGRYG